MARSSRRWMGCTVAALVAVLAAAQVEAQSKNRGQAKQQNVRGERVDPRPELLRREAGWDLQVRQGRQGPPFCRNGQGHPVHGRQWCIDRGFGLGRAGTVRRSGTVWDTRTGDRRARSFEEAHEAFHRQHDRRCRLLAAERPLDLTWQLRVRAQCRDEHERWHARNDPRR